MMSRVFCLNWCSMRMRRRIAGRSRSQHVQDMIPSESQVWNLRRIASTAIAMLYMRVLELCSSKAMLRQGENIRAGSRSGRCQIPHHYSTAPYIRAATTTEKAIYSQLPKTPRPTIKSNTMSSPYKDCTEVSLQCPVEATTYGYVPNLASNSILAAIFAICTLGQASLAVRFRTWGFGFAATVGCLLECLGYVGRIVLNNNVWNHGAFALQLLTLVVAPSFLAAAIYLTLKHMVQHFGPQYSHLRPVLYVWTFVCSDVACIALQAIGGGIAVGGDDNNSPTDIANDLIIAGLAIQVAVMGICILLAMNFTLNLRKGRIVSKRPQDFHEPEPSMKSFRVYLGCICLAFLMIFIRSVYRVPEFASGWGSELMRDELDFMLLDGMMIAIASVTMTIGHAGICIQATSSKAQREEKVAAQYTAYGAVEMA